MAKAKKMDDPVDGEVYDDDIEDDFEDSEDENDGLEEEPEKADSREKDDDDDIDEDELDENQDGEGLEGEDDLGNQEKRHFLCPKCGAYYVNNKWVVNPDTSLAILKSALAYCNKCFKSLFDDDFIGRVELYDKDLKNRKDSLIETAERVERTLENSLEFERVISVYEENDILIINTNTTRLARAIGKNIREEFKGGIEFSWLDKNQFLIVKWFDELKNSQYFKERLRQKKERFPGSLFFEEED